MSRLFVANGCAYVSVLFRVYKCTEELGWLFLYDTVCRSWGWMPCLFVEGLISEALSDEPRKAQRERRKIFQSTGHCPQNTPSSRLLGWLSIVYDLKLLMKLHSLDKRECSHFPQALCMSGLPCPLILLKICGLSHLSDPITIGTIQLSSNEPHYGNN